MPRDEVTSIDLLIINAEELITLQGPNHPRKKEEMNELGIIKKGMLAIDHGHIVDVGADLDYDAEKVIDATGYIVIPGFVDPHTHLVFGGSREFELDWKLRGYSYMDIRRKGGGIDYTVSHTRDASFDSLYQQSKTRLDNMLTYGTTTCEAKSGYGLNLETEQRILDVQNQLNKDHLIDIVSTFLGAHSIPKEMKDEEYVDLVIDEMIPLAQPRAEFCDVFCEEGFFSIDQSRRILNAGKKAGLTPKIHADELVDTNGGMLAAEVGAISAEHLLKTNTKSMKQMAEKNVIGVMLPGTPFSLMMKEYAPARKMIDVGVPLALATDLNPNCYVENMQFMMQLGCFNMKMTPAEALTAATFNASCAINREQKIGSLEVGKQADVLILSIPNYKMIPYHFGVNHVSTVIKNGMIVKSNDKE
ncbi:MAG: imidazolonepropionase [Candidatus Thermoplasmatota archaeon]|nr:imidazolonepropionase [Candidatus Thermoplasmatota archaeon]